MNWQNKYPVVKGLLQIDDFYHQLVTAFFFLQKK